MLMRLSSFALWADREYDAASATRQAALESRHPGRAVLGVRGGRRAERSFAGGSFDESIDVCPDVCSDLRRSIHEPQSADAVNGPRKIL